MGFARRDDGPARMRNKIGGRIRTDVGEMWVSNARNSKDTSIFPEKR